MTDNNPVAPVKMLKMCHSRYLHSNIADGTTVYYIFAELNAISDDFQLTFTFAINSLYPFMFRAAL